MKLWNKTNTHGINWDDLKIGTRISCAYEVNLGRQGKHICNVEGIITREIFCYAPKCYCSQIKITKQLNLKDIYDCGINTLSAIYIDNIVKIL
jgi:hypothetical protein